jgi:peptidylprolyl isomerase
MLPFELISHNCALIPDFSLLQCTPDYAYGAGGFPAWGIQPDSVLVFEIEVLSA